MVGTVLGVILAIAVLTGCGFYFIPKYAMKTSNVWITAIDKAITWIGQNWIVFTIIAVLVVALIVTLTIAIKKRR